MFAEPYIKALRVDEVAADRVWELWNAGLTSGWDIERALKTPVGSRKTAQDYHDLAAKRNKK